MAYGGGEVKQTTKESFWAFIMGAKYDIQSNVEGAYPYTSLFKTGTGLVVGRIVERYANAPAKWPMERDYFLAEVA